VSGRGQRSEIQLRRLGRAAASGVRSTVVAWIAILALIVQLGSSSVPQAMANTGDAEAVAALGALTALLGPNVALCERNDASAPGSPSHDSHHCCDDCALCQLTGHLAGLVPSSHAVPTIFARHVERTDAPEDASAARPRLVSSAQPRAPPISPNLT
jgi:hypothetical protein